jgi:hypothetical protein
MFLKKCYNPDDDVIIQPDDDSNAIIQSDDNTEFKANEIKSSSEAITSASQMKASMLRFSQKTTKM